MFTLPKASIDFGSLIGVSTLQLAHRKLLRVRLVAGGAGRVRKEPLRRAKPTARRETGEGEIHLVAFAVDIDG